MDDPHQSPPVQPPASRLQLLWDVLVFQFKLAMDGLRDVILVPVSLLAALLDFVVGGRQPGRFFSAVINFGRRTETWINLFGHQRNSTTADDIIKPIQEKVFAQAEHNPVLQKAGASLNRSLDSVGDAIKRPAGASPGSSVAQAAGRDTLCADKPGPDLPQPGKRTTDS